MTNRRNARQEKKAFIAARSSDSSENFMAHFGRGTGNQHDASHYGFKFRPA